MSIQELEHNNHFQVNQHSISMHVNPKKLSTKEKENLVTILNHLLAIHENLIY